MVHDSTKGYIEMARTRTVKQTKPVEKMSSRELYVLAERREKEEAERTQAEALEKISALREQKRQVTAEYRSIVARLDREIKRLGGRPTKAKQKTASQPKGRGGVSAEILKIIGDKGQASTSEIKAALGKRSIDAANLAQTLAYLKRNGRITSPARATYTLA